MPKKKVIPQIVKDVRAFKPKEIDWANQKLISYSQFSIYNECPKKWSLQYVEGHKQFTVLPAVEEYSFYHPKTIEKQEKQNNYYNTL